MTGQNSLLLAESGSGKTLAYLLPILNKIYYECDEIQKPRVFGIPEMFQNAEDIYFQRKQECKNMSHDEQINKTRMKGSIVIAPSRELLNQIYALIRRLDTDNVLNVNRAGSSVQLFAPIVEHLTQEGTYKNKREISTDEADAVSVKNIVNNAKWEMNDILLTTPMILKFLIDEFDSYAPYDINPSIIALDEFDLLLNNPGMEEAMIQIIRKFGGRSDRDFSRFNMRRQFILSGSCLPDKIHNKNSLDFVNSMFSDMKMINTNNFDKVNPRVKFNWVDVESLPYSEDEHLLRLIQEDFLRDYNTIIFCENQKICDKISSILFEKDIPNLPYYTGMESDLRLETLHQLYLGKCRVIVSTNLMSRGLDTMNVGHVIEYNFSKTKEDYINRIGRTGRMGMLGKVTSFARKGDEDMVSEILNLYHNSK